MEKILMLKEDYKTINKIIKSADKGRDIFGYIKITKDALYATNGRSAFKRAYDFEVAPAGVYEIIKTDKASAGFITLLIEKADLEFPDIEGIYKGIEPLKAEDQFDITINTEPMVQTRAVLDLFKATKNAYSIELIQSFASYGARWRVISHKEDGPAVLKYDDITMIILPFKE